jgi:hypothetical protein
MLHSEAGFKASAQLFQFGPFRNCQKIGGLHAGKAWLFKHLGLIQNSFMPFHLETTVSNPVLSLHIGFAHPSIITEAKPSEPND